MTHHANIPPEDYNHDLGLMPCCDHDLIMKMHISSLGSSGSLCGRSSVHASGALGYVNADWINQPDPDGKMCKTCKKIALKLLSPPVTEGDKK